MFYFQLYINQHSTLLTVFTFQELMQPGLLPPMVSKIHWCCFWLTFLIDTNSVSPSPRWWSAGGRSHGATGRHSGAPVLMPAARRPEHRSRGPHHRHHQDRLPVRLVGGATGGWPGGHLPCQLCLLLTPAGATTAEGEVITRRRPLLSSWWIN